MSGKDYEQALKKLHVELVRRRSGSSTRE